MSSAAICSLLSPVTLQTRHYFMPALGVEEWWCIDFGRPDYRSARLRQRIVRVEKLEGLSGRTNRSRSIVVQAGLGRFSGSIHGNSQRDSRRRSPMRQDEHCENVPPAQQDEHCDSASSTEEVVQSREESPDSVLGDAREVSTVDLVGDVSVDGQNELDYNRYLQEIGVSPQVHKDGESLSDPEYGHQHLDRMETVSDPTIKLSVEGNMTVDGAVPLVDGDVAGKGFMENNGKKKENMKRERDSKSDGAEYEMKMSKNVECASENGSISADKISSVAATLPPTAENISRTTSLVKEKQPKKRTTKAALSSSSKFEENFKNERAGPVLGGAERPANSLELAGSSSKIMPEEVQAMKGIDTDENLAEKSVQNVRLEKDEEPLKGARNESDAEIVAVVKPAHSYTQEHNMSDNVAEEFIRTNEEPNSMRDKSDENKYNELKMQDSPRIVFGKAGGAGIAVADELQELRLSSVGSVVVERSAQRRSQVVDTDLELAVRAAIKEGPDVIVEHDIQEVSMVVELPTVVVEAAAQIESLMVEILPETVIEQVGQAVDQVVELQTQAVEQVSSAAEQVVQFGQMIVDQVSEAGDSVVEQVSDVAEQVASAMTEQVQQVSETVSSTASQVAEQVTTSVDNVTSTATQVVEQVTDFFGSDSDDDATTDSDDEFEAYKTSDLPEFRGKRGLANFIIKQDGGGFLFRIYDIYTYMLKQPFPKFAAAMFSAPIIVSGIFTLLYLPQVEGLAFDDTARDFFAAAGVNSLTLQLSWRTLFEVFMFSLSLSTGLQPELAPLSPYTLVVANANALVAQLVFVFLSGAVFARLSQPSQPVRCSTVALVSTSPSQRRRKENGIKVFMARYVLAGPQPCELVDVKVDLTYKYNTLTRTGSFFRATQSLKLVRPEIAFLTHGMLIRHVIDQSSPLYQRTQEMLRKEDAMFCLSVVGLERASMQSVFHVQHYCVVDDHVIWDAEFEDIILINKKNKRVVDHSRLSMWKRTTH